MIISNTVRRLILINGNTLHGTAPPFSFYHQRELPRHGFLIARENASQKGIIRIFHFFPGFLYLKRIVWKFLSGRNRKTLWANYSPN